MRREMDRQEASFARLARAAHAAVSVQWTARRRPRRGCGTRRACAKATPGPRSKPARCASCCPRPAHAWRDGEISTGAGAHDHRGARRRARRHADRVRVGAVGAGATQRSAQPSARRGALPQPRLGRRHRARGPRRAARVATVRRAHRDLRRARRPRPARPSSPHSTPTPTRRRSTIPAPPRSATPPRWSAWPKLRSRTSTTRRGRKPTSRSCSTGRPSTTGSSAAPTASSPDRSTPRTSNGSSATARSAGSSPAPTPSPSMSAAAGAPSPRRYEERSSNATKAADSPAAGDHPGGAKRTTPSTGKTEEPPTSTT